MNGKKAKMYRRKAKELADRYIIERVLTPDMYAEATPEQLKNVLPRSILMRVKNSLVQMFGTRRFFNQAVKRKPDVTYDELDSAMYRD